MEIEPIDFVRHIPQGLATAPEPLPVRDPMLRALRAASARDAALPIALRGCGAGMRKAIVRAKEAFLALTAIEDSD